MASAIDPNAEKLDSLVSDIINAKCIDTGANQKLREIFCQAALKIENSRATDQHDKDNLNRIQTAKRFYDWRQIKSLLVSGEQNLVKGRELSVKLREKGNEFYKDKLLDKAIRGYTLAIMFAPASSEELGISYANRSAVLLQLGKPQEAIEDITKSLLHCPDKLKKTLEERLSKCKSLVDKNVNNAATQNGGASSIRNSTNFFELSETNPTIPNAQNFVQIRHTEEKGRHLVVTEDISAGSVLLVDQPFVSALSNLLTWETDHCHNCSKSITNGIPCEQCVFTIFCSESCLQLACSPTGMHHFEHLYLPVLQTLCKPHKDIQALRLLAIVGPQTLHKLWKSKDRIYFNGTSNGGLLGFDDAGVYNSKSYLPLYHLVAHDQDSMHEEGISVGILNALNSLLLKDLLKDYSKFFRIPRVKLPLPEDFEDFIASLILRHVENIKYNAISLSKLTNDDQKSVAFAVAVYPLISLCNHSCDPNCAPVKKTPHLQTSLVSLTHLKKGDELCITYKPLYSNMKTYERQSFLAEGYRFICNCQPCEENWGPSIVRSYKSGGTLILEPSTCTSCVTNDNLGENPKPRQCHGCVLKDVNRAKEIQKMEKILFECHDLLKQQDYTSNIERLPEVLDYFGKNGFHSHFPLYFIAIDLYKRALVKSVN